MRLEELVGKKVLRTAPRSMNGDRSFMSTESVVEVLEIVDGVPLVKVTYDFLDRTERIKDLIEYNDDNWMDATEVFKRLDELRVELNNTIED